MKIGLLGYGKMGKAIESLSLEQGFTVVWKIGASERAALTDSLMRQADVVIEFSRPEAAFENVMACINAGVPVVSGTTGWTDALPAAQKACLEQQSAFIWASNFSVGVNLFFALNRYLARLMNARPEYQPAVEEWHHIHKLDAPSGTGLTLTKDIIGLLDRKDGWVLRPTVAGQTEIPITAYREGEIPGTHQINWESAIDSITIEHKAHSRTGFALGAVLAARWLQDKKGVFTMADVLGIE
ncbi:MAG: 4-hydroxy-tetrahydrodipicolinate reductase [Saprospiraceae bacterium]|nr:4-hydroxy-tetrahydrodipicolinate reductase [Saprospiraceae bacterium]